MDAASRRLIIGFCLLTLAWVFGNPAGASPDEPSNYIKALGIAHGQVLGSRGSLPPEVAARYHLDGAPLSLANLTTRWVEVPPGLLLPAAACDAFRPDVPASCLDQAVAAAPISSAHQPTYAGTYPPYVYALPSLLSLLATNGTAGYLLVRLGFAFLCLSLLTLAVRLLADGDRLRLVGLMLGVTPMAVFASANITASGPEICGGVCFFVSLFTLLWRRPIPTLAWSGLVAGGVALALSRPLGIVWIALALVVALLTYRAEILGAIRLGGRASRLSVSLIGVAIALGLGWAVLVEPHEHASPVTILSLIPGAVGWFPENLREAIGVFGWLDTFMPNGMYVLYELTLLAMLVIAIAIGNARQRLTLALFLLATVAACLIAGPGLLEQGGLALQGRHVLGFAVAVPLYAGFVLWESRHRLSAVVTTSLVSGASLIVSLTQAIAWYFNARRYAVGAGGTLAFLPASQWRPLLGWIPWLALGMAGAFLLATVGAGELRQARRRGRISPRATTPMPARTRRRIVVLPAYRAEKTLRDVVAAIPKGEVDGVLLVDDASVDRTAEIALELGIDVIKHPKNLGYGGNQKTCYANALLMGAEVVVMLHPDGQYDPSLVPSLCRAVEEGKGDIVLGSRWLGLDPAAAGMPRWKRLGNRFLTAAENWILGLHLSEYHTGYRAYSRRFLQSIPYAENSNDFAFDTQVLVQAAALGFRIGEIPAIGRYFEDASSIGLKTSIIYGLKTLLALTSYLGHRGGLPCRWLTPTWAMSVGEDAQVEAGGEAAA